MQPRRYAPWLLIGIGAAIMVGIDRFDVTGRLQLGLVVVGAVLLFAGIVAHDLLAKARCLDDESDRLREYRSGHFGFVVLGALLVTSLLVVTTTGVAVATELVLVAAVAVGLATYTGSRAYLGRAT
jgi:hypothetical protein